LFKPADVLFGVLLQVFFAETKGVPGGHRREYLLNALFLTISVYVHVHALGRHVVAVITHWLMTETNDRLPLTIESVFQLATYRVVVC
jgi:hypothetical protein